jgi:hypothetical protein
MPSQIWYNVDERQRRAAMRPSPAQTGQPRSRVPRGSGPGSLADEVTCESNHRC